MLELESSCGAALVDDAALSGELAGAVVTIGCVMPPKLAAPPSSPQAAASRAQVSVVDSSGGRMVPAD